MYLRKCLVRFEYLSVSTVSKSPGKSFHPIPTGINGILISERLFVSAYVLGCMGSLSPKCGIMIALVLLISSKCEDRSRSLGNSKNLTSPFTDFIKVFADSTINRSPTFPPISLTVFKTVYTTWHELSACINTLHQTANIRSACVWRQ